MDLTKMSTDELNDLQAALKGELARRSGKPVLIAQGADVLSFGVNRMAPDARARVDRVVLVSPGLEATFEFHVGNWFGGSDAGLPIEPEADRLDAASTLCLHGVEEETSLCPRIAGTHARSIGLPGGHHYRGDYDEVARTLLGHMFDR